MQTFETKDQIKTRILQDMAREWGYRGMSDIDLTSFDPVVDLLIGGCSYEIERLSHDITNSRNRIFERLIEILTPDIMTKAQPAYAMAHALPSEPTYITEKSDQIFYKNPELKKDFFFSAAGNFRLTDAAVQYIAHGNRIMKINERLEKDLYAEATYGKYIHPENIYLGISINKQIKTLSNLTFFFDWKNETQVNHLLNYLPLTSWSIENSELSIHSGWAQSDKKPNEHDDIFNSLGLEKYIQQHIFAACRPHFISISDDTAIVKDHLNKLPDALLEVFAQEGVDTLEQDLLWIKIDLPNALRDHVSDMDCYLNCFPVINRQLHEKQEKLNDKLFIMPIEVGEDHFLSVESMTNSNQLTYKEVPLKMVKEDDHGMYAIRDRGVNRFDSREANHLLKYTLDMVEDEAAAFRGLGYATVSSDLADLETVFNRIHKNFHRSKSDLENTTFLFIRPFQHDPLIHLKYWTTNGDLANRIPHGTPLKLFSNSNLIANSIQFVTSSQGGKAKMQPVDSVNAFREIVMTRGRIVTKEDIKSFCLNQIGQRNIASINIKKGVHISKHSSEGLIRTIDVSIQRNHTSPLEKATWYRMCNEAEIQLNQKASSVFPIRVISKETE